MRRSSQASGEHLGIIYASGVGQLGERFLHARHGGQAGGRPAQRCELADALGGNAEHAVEVVDVRRHLFRIDAEEPLHGEPPERATYEGAHARNHRGERAVGIRKREEALLKGAVVVGRRRSPHVRNALCRAP
ncbi:MAG TPA: hypothetical protein VK988_00205 [Acidimicrobiales bacterium]|nr:hypothetical protein [Acidimicrobiales bacterium]